MFRLTALLLIALALFVSPLGMRLGGQAMAHAPAAEAFSKHGHCDEAPADINKPAKQKAGCIGMCSALPLTSAAAVAAAPVLKSMMVIRPLRRLGSIQPESETPPPRLS